MKIAYDLRRIKNPGIGRYMKCLAAAVLEQAPENEYLLILPPGAEQLIPAGGAPVEKLTTSLSYYSLREQLQLPQILQRHAVDVLHAPHFNVPLASSCPVVVTIHDLIYRACKEDLRSLAGRMYYRAMMAGAVRVAQRIVTDSEFSRRDILQLLNADPLKVEVICPGVDPIFQGVTDHNRIEHVRSQHGIVDDYILYTGIYKPRKNHAGLLRAFREFLSSAGRAQLVIAGSLCEGETALRRLARELGISANVIFTGFVPDEDLAALYSAARVYACPSLYEGFGFTVLEAMACGTPVVCSGETSLPEVAGDAALYADPRNRAEFAAAMARLFNESELRTTLVAKGTANCSRFRWETTARRMLAIYRQIARQPAGEVVCA